MVLDGPINRIAFQAYVEQVLVPGLRLGDIVVMDNLSSHNGPDMRLAIEAAGAQLLYLPPTAPTSIRSRTPSPNSKLSCVRRPNQPSAVSGIPSATSSTSSRRRNVPTTSPPQDTSQNKANPL
jgi:hypothetical protein